MNYWLLSCEHAGNEAPEAYQAIFQKGTEALHSHRGFDPGAFSVFKNWVPYADWATYYPYTRLLIELNRSLGHKALFSTFSNALADQDKQHLITNYYNSYRNKVEQQVKEQLTNGKQLIHIGVHSFTPILNGKTRNADIGLLYNPANKLEKDAASCWKICLERAIPEIKVRMNYPYLGKADGFTTYLRKKYKQRYAGLEFELNQKYAGNLDMIEKLRTAFKLFRQEFS